MPEIIVGRDWEDLKKYGDKGTITIGKNIVGTGAETHLASEIKFDVLRPHIVVVVGKRGSGKCVLPDTKLILSNGDEKTVEEIFKKSEKEKVYENKNEEIYNIKNNIGILSIDENLNEKKNKVARIYRKKVKEKLIKIKTKTGKEIVVTKEHPLLTIDNKLKWIEAKELSNKNYIGLPRNLKIKGKNSKLKIPEEFKEYTIYNRKSQTEAKNNKTANYSDFRDIKYNTYFSSIYSLRQKGLVNILGDRRKKIELTKEGKKLSKKLKLEHRFGKGNCTKLILPKIVSVDFASWLAYWIAEGCEEKMPSKTTRFLFSNKDQRKIDEFKKLTEKLFGVRPKFYKNYLYFDSTILSEFLKYNGIRLNQKSRGKDIPNFIMSADNKIVSKFLKTFFNCEGYAGESKIELPTASKKIADKISLLLLRFGILCSVKKKIKYAANTKNRIKRNYYYIYIYGENLKKFLNFVDLEPEKKKKIKLKKSNPNLDVIPKIGKLLRNAREKSGLPRRKLDKFKQEVKSYEDEKYFPSRKKLKNLIKNIDKESPELTILKKLTDSNIFWDKIEKIEELNYTGYVYDLTVPHTHNFVAGSNGGIFCHNSYTSQVIAEEIYKLPDEIRNNLSVISIDTQGIFWSMKYPNNKQRDLLYQWGLKPEKFDVFEYVPLGQKEKFEEMGVLYDKTFSFKPSELTVADWCYSLGFGENELEGILLSKVLNKMKGNYSIDDIASKLREEEFDEKIKLRVENILLNAKNWGIFSSEGTDVYEFLQPAKIVIFDVSLFGGGVGWNVKSLIVGLLMKKIYEARVLARRKEELAVIEEEEKKKRKVPLCWIITDEAHNFIPSTGSTAASDIILTVIRQGRQPGISQLFVTQMPDKLHSDVLSQADLVIAHRLTSQRDIDALKAIMQTYLLYSIEKYLDELPKLKGVALILDDNSERLYKIRIRPRQSWHGGESPVAL